MSQYNRMKG